MKRFFAGMMAMLMLMLAGFALAEDGEMVAAYTEVGADGTGRTLPRFVMDDASLRRLAGLHGVAILLPEELPAGYARSEWVSVRKTENGIIGAAQEAFAALFAEADGVPDEDGLLWYEVPMAAMEGATYVGLMYKTGPEDEGIMYLARIATPRTLHAAIEGALDMERGTLKENVEAHAFADGGIGFVQRRGDVVFLMRMGAEALAAVMDPARADEVIVTYEVSGNEARFAEIVALAEGAR